MTSPTARRARLEEITARVDASFITFSRDNVRWLLADIARLEAERDELAQQLDDLYLQIQADSR